MTSIAWNQSSSFILKTKEDLEVKSCTSQNILKTNEKLVSFMWQKKVRKHQDTAVHDHIENIIMKRERGKFPFCFSDMKKVLDKRIHKLDFKTHGSAEVTVKLPENCTSNKKMKPAVLPKPKLEKVVKVLQASEVIFYRLWFINNYYYCVIIRPFLPHDSRDLDVC